MHVTPYIAHIGSNEDATQGFIFLITAKISCTCFYNLISAVPI